MSKVRTLALGIGAVGVLAGLGMVVDHCVDDQNPSDSVIDRVARIDAQVDLHHAESELLYQKIEKLATGDVCKTARVLNETARRSHGEDDQAIANLAADLNAALGLRTEPL